MNAQQLQSYVALAAAVAPIANSLVTSVFGVVRGIEAALPSSTGTQKFDAALAQLEGIYGAFVHEIPAIGGIVNAAVATLNAIGEFRKASNTTSAPATV